MDAIPTPPASSLAPSSHASPLPAQRRHPLKPGGSKESELIRYLDHGLNDVQKRVDNRLQKQNSTEGNANGGFGAKSEGYDTFGDVEKDLEGLIDVVWVSGSPNLQVPYLLNVARMIFEFIPLFPSSPRATFRLLDKLDSAFSSLLQGRDLDTGEPLPGFEGGRTISTTDKVRLKGIVDRTRLIVVRKIGRGVGGKGDEDGDRMEIETEDESMADSEAEDTVKFEGFEDDDEDEEDEEEWRERQISSVYEKTIGELGDELVGPPIGIITDD